MSAIFDCLNEILIDENGNTITPECGIHKLLSEMCNAIENMENDPTSITIITNAEIDEITSE